MKVDRKCLRGWPRSKWEQQIMKDILEGRKNEKEELWKDRGTIDGYIWVMGNPHKSGSIGGRSREEIKITHAQRTD